MALLGIPITRTISPEGIDALIDGVELHMYWATHGYEGDCAQINYDHAYDVVTALEPDRGDVLAVEGYNYPDPQFVHPHQIIDRLHLLPDVNSDLEPYFGAHPADILQAARENQAMSSFQYATALACLHDIPVVYADANRQETVAWNEYFHTRIAHHVGEQASEYVEPILRLVGFGHRKRDYVYRELPTLACLGDAALAFGQPHRPRLSTLRGASHKKSFGNLLTENGVRFTSHDI
ncbi:MAG TPA: hypothetical protein VJP80_05075 [Candidatus Saccharimonadales bacterium]|nr:hypothetical protein [Candidatus Saccharimonadales bacterium]